MKKYEKPVVMINEELAEGVYAASGDSCYVVRCNIVQTPAEGFNYYVVQLNADHNTNNHHSTGQVMTVTFDINVNFDSMSSGKATYVSGNGTNVLVLNTTYHSECPELGIGLGELRVVPLGGTLTKVSAELSCNYTCGQHDHLGNY